MPGSSTFGASEAVQKLRRSPPDQEATRGAVGQASERMFNVSARRAAVEKLREALADGGALNPITPSCTRGIFSEVAG